MKRTSKWVMLGLSLSLTSALMVGCNTNEETTTEKRPNIVQESTIEVDIKDSQLITQTGFLNGFPEKNLVEFKVVKDSQETLRVFEMGKDISTYLSEEKQDGKSEFTLTYQESKDGITNPILVKIEKK